MVHGGTLTSGSFALSVGLFENSEASATVSGDNFTAVVIEPDVGPFDFNGFPPFTVGPTGFSWDGADNFSFVDYNGIRYDAGFLLRPISRSTLRTCSATALKIGPAPTITGPGFYPMLFSVELDFWLYSTPPISFFLPRPIRLFAAGGITYTSSGIPGNSFVYGGPLQGSIPEPSTLSYYLLAGFCLALFARIRAVRRDPA